MRRLPVRLWHQLNHRLDLFFAWREAAAMALWQKLTGWLSRPLVRPPRRRFVPEFEGLEDRRLFSTMPFQGNGGTPIIEPDQIPIGPFLLQPETGNMEIDVPLAADASASPDSYYHLLISDSRPIVESTFTTTQLPSSITLTLTWNGAAQTPVTFSTSGHGATDTYLLAGEVDRGPTATGRYPWSLTAQFNGSTDPAQTVSGYANFVGTDFTGVDQLFPVTGGELRVYDSGSARFFATSGSGYTSPADDFGTLSNLSGGGFKYLATDGDQYLYNSSGLLTGIVDPHGNITTYQYASGLLTEVDYPNNTKATLLYDMYGHLSSITDPGGQLVTANYYPSGLLAGITNPDGGLMTFSYSINYMNLKWGPLNTTVTYDSNTLPVSIDEGLGSVWTIKTGISEGRSSPAMNSNMQGVAVITDPLSNATTYTLDPLGRLLKEQTVDGATQQWQRYSSGLVSVAIDGRGYSTTMLYDVNGNLTETLYPDGTNEQYGTYNSFAEPSYFQDRLGHRTTYLYDATGNLTSLEDPLQNYTAYTYYTNGLLATMGPVESPPVNPTSYYYDSNDRLSVVVDPLGNSTTYVRDVAGDVTVVQTSPKAGVTYYNQYYYDGMSRLTGVTDPANGSIIRLTYTYNPIGEVTQRQELGRTTNYTYDQRGWLSVVTDAAGTSAQAVTTYLYDLAGNVTGTQDPDGNLVQYQYYPVTRTIATLDTVTHIPATTIYDANGNVTGTIDFNGNRTTFLYDPMNRLTGVTDAAGNTSHTYYDANGNVTQVTDAGSYSTQYYYDLDNRLTMVSDALGTVEKLYYDKVGNVTQMTDANSNPTTYAFDANYRMTSSTDGLNNHTFYYYDNLGNLTEVLDAKSHPITYTYDPDHRVVTVIDALGDQTQTYYDRVGNVTQVTDPNGNVATYAYDVLNRLIGTTDGAADRTSILYDLAGNVTQYTDGTGNITKYSYDGDNRLSVTIDPLTKRTTTTYDNNGNVVQVTDPLNHSTTYVYDVLNRPTVTIDALGARTTVVYDGAGHICEVVDGNGHATLFATDARNRVTAETDALSHRTTYTYYGGTDEVLSSTDANGRETAYSYDADSRLTGVTLYSDAGSTRVGTMAYAYDSVGNMTFASDSETILQPGTTYTLSSYSASYTLAYDAVNRVSSVQEPFGMALTFAYDNVGNRTKVQDNFGGLTTSAYDGANRLITLQYTGQGSTQMRVDLSYNGDSEINHEIRYNSVAGGTSAIVGTTTILYDGLGRMTGLQQWNHLQTIMLDNITYVYDPAGRMTITQENTYFTFHYGYDNDNQLTSDGYNNYTGGATITYDNVGNRTNTGYTTNAVNQYTSDGTWNYSYDGDGNLVKKVKISTGETWLYGYDNFNHLQLAQDWTADPSVYSTATLNTSVVFEVDAFGNRIEEDVYPGGVGPPVTTRFAYDGWNPAKADATGTAGFDVWADLNADSTLQTRYLHGDGVDQVFAQIGWNTVTSTASPYWLLTDRLGSVHEATDNSTGSVVETLTYDGWGNLINGSELAGRTYGFAGREWDSNVGLYYDRARYYDPTVGRFTTEDPGGVLAGDTNAYRYVGNQPTNATDPSGDVSTVPLLSLSASLLLGGTSSSRISGGRIFWVTPDGSDLPVGDIVDHIGGTQSVNGSRYAEYPGDSFGYLPLDAVRSAIEQMESPTTTQTGRWIILNRAQGNTQRANNPRGNSDASLPLASDNSMTVGQGAAAALPFIRILAILNAEWMANVGVFVRGIRFVFSGGVWRNAGTGARATAAQARQAAQVARTAAAARNATTGFGGLSNAARYGIRPYGQLQRTLSGTGLQAHHLIPRRFAQILGVNQRQMPSIAVTAGAQGEHQVFTNAWQTRFPNGTTPTVDEILNAARDIYRNYPAILQALGL